MSYETYKLGKLKKNSVRKCYTRRELESFELPRLREICNAEHIKPPTVDTLSHKEAMVELLYRYLGAAKRMEIVRCQREGCERLAEALNKNGRKLQGTIEVPARLEFYKEIAADGEEAKYTVFSSLEEFGEYAFLQDGNGEIQAIFTLLQIETHQYRMSLRRECIAENIRPGHFQDMRLIFVSAASVDEAVRRYLGKERKKSVISYYQAALPEVWIREVLETKEPLIIDFGTSYTAAGTFSMENLTVKRVCFGTAKDCEWECVEGPGGCGLSPSVIAVKDCSDPKNISFMFGEEAVQEERNRGFFAKNSIFYDAKRWVNRYRERILITDMAGNSMEVERLLLVRQFLLYIIDRAQQQNQMRYKNLCFTCPVKQKARSLKMYQEALPEYHVVTKDVTDEAVAVVYRTLEQKIRSQDYEDGAEKKALILDCGGGTSDMVQCDYRITNEAITSRLELRVTYAHGDTNFGGNNLTWRVLQFLKIRLAEYFTNKAAAPMEQWFPGVFSDLYEFADQRGAGAAYSVFERKYQEAEAVVPTAFLQYQSQPEDVYLKVKGNYYFLWNLAEAVKKRMYQRQGVCMERLDSFFDEKISLQKKRESSSVFEDFHLFVKKENGMLETQTICPELFVAKEEINLLLKPDIYGFLKNFIEPWYDSGRLMDMDQILLSGQSSKIDLFREVLKEYVAGRKAKAGGENGCARKFMCVDGAAVFQQDKRTGRIRTIVNYEPARAPYSLSAEDYRSGGQEKLLLQRGSPMGGVYGFISRPVETEEILFFLMDGNGKKITSISYLIHQEDYQETGYGDLLTRYPFLYQEDLDSISDGELRIFVFAEDESWGCAILETARREGRIYSKQPGFLPFENGAWETDFFDGKH